MWKNLLSTALDAAQEYADNRTTPRGSSSAAVSSSTPAWERFREVAVSAGNSAVPANSTVLRSLGASALQAVERKVKQAVMPAAEPATVSLALFSTRLADLAYLSTAQQLQQGLMRVDPRLELIHFQPQPLQNIRDRNSSDPGQPQWFLSRFRDGSELHLVFRGTASNDDVVRDLMARPVEHGGLRFHGGFLAGVRDEPVLRSHLDAHLTNSTMHLYLMGHSLGGSLALVLPLVVPAMIPLSHRGELTVVAIGSPPVIHGPLNNNDTSSGAGASSSSSASADLPSRFSEAVRTGEPVVNGATAATAQSGLPRAVPISAGGAAASSSSAAPAVPVGVPIGVPLGTVVPPGSSSLPRDALRCRALVVVNRADAVPRLLGSPLPLSTSPLLADFARQAITTRLGVAVAADAARAGPTVAAARAEEITIAADQLLKTLPDYVHLPQTEVVLVRPGVGGGFEAIAVPPTERTHVLHLHEAFSPAAIAHHSTPQYERSLEAALQRPGGAGRRGPV